MVRVSAQDQDEPDDLKSRDYEIIDKLFELAKNGNRAGAGVMIKAWNEAHRGENLIVSILEPFLNLVGEKWQQGDMSLAQAYVANKIVEDAILEYKVSADKEVRSHIKLKGPIVIGNIEGDFHGLGRKMVGLFLEGDGWEVIDLGVDVPAEEFVETACRVGARAIGVSAMMYGTAENIIKIRRILDERGLSGKIKLAVGGAVFRLQPELAWRVGADGTCESAIEAPALFERLWKESKETEGVS
ncbi:corrinoid-binding protein [Methanocella sp. CWC-04]|uniref:Corrinoid-binding protein n=1 Tax=Methanooceanicella nereidis TaxID=2052831 RepID=A0AAP2REA3_9EURY|nr:cobalamin-dependent protein [Methanocella sp. CWC-04]MCD1295779.1 corrinoid-binding protein [Methanocella sp. CWC-04]